MNLTKEQLKAWASKRFSYRAKTMLFSCEADFSYEIEEERFNAGLIITVKSLGKILYQEKRSSRYFLNPQVRWIDFTKDAEHIVAHKGAFDLCLLPFVFQIQGSDHFEIYLNQWKEASVERDSNSICFCDEKIDLALIAGADGLLESVEIKAPIVKKLRIERRH